MSGLGIATDRLTPERRRQWAFVALVAAALVLPAAYFAWSNRHLRLPSDLDLFRDAAQADAVRHGRLLGDWAYAGEAVWYNPLGSWIVAAVSWFTGASVVRAVTAGGIVLNLFTPVMLVVVATRWFGRTCAGFALIGYVFLLAAGFPAWAVATYSPWLFQSVPAQGLFFAALLCLPQAIDSERWTSRVALGVLSGLVVLAHTGPVVVLAVVVLATAVRSVHRQRVGIAQAAGRSAAIAGIAALLSAVFWAPLLWRYRFRVVNARPAEFVWDRIEPAAIDRFTWDYVVRWPVLLGAIGLVAWIVRRGQPARGTDAMWLLGTWTAVSGVLLAVAVVGRSSMPGAGAIPDVVPAHHYLLYLTAAACLWFGIGMATLARLIAGRLAPGSPWIVAVGIAVVMVAIAVPGWRSRDDRVAARATSEYIATTFERFAVSTWIEATTPGDAIVLYDVSGDPAVMANALDGRRAVVIDNPYFSSPYVRWEPRYADARAMVAALAACDLDAFDTVDAEYGVDFVVADAGSAVRNAVDQCRALSSVYDDANFAVIAVANAAGR